MQLATADDIVVWVNMLGGQPVTELTIRQWASRGLIGRHGRRGRRTLYDLTEVQSLVERRSDAAA